MPALIKEFQFDDQPWRIVWLGRVIYTAGAQSEPRIEVFLTKLKPAYEKPFSKDSLADPSEHRVVQIKIGQISLLRIGTVWLQGVESPPRKALDTIDITSQHDQFDLMRFDGQVEMDGETVPALGARRYRVGGQASRQLADSWIAVVHDPKPGIRLLVIPSTVLFQKCIATSPKAVRHLVYGQLDKIVDPRSDFLRDKPTTYYLNLFKDFRDSEAKAMANLRADPVARREYRRFRNALIVESANHDRTRTGERAATHIKMSLPFSNPVGLSVKGKYLPFGSDEWGFLATEIVDLKTQLVFNELILDRKNDGGKGDNAGDPDLPTAFPITDQRPTEFSEPDQPLTSVGDPSESLEQLSLAASGDFDAIGLTVIKEAKEVQRYRAWPRGGGPDDDYSGTGTTGEPGNHLGGLAEVDITVRQTPKVPVTLELFFETLALVAAQGIVFETLVVARVHRKRDRDRHVVNFLRDPIKGVRNWHLTSNEEGAPPRGYVVAETQRGHVWHYLIELQRKGEAALALAHIREHDGSRIERRKLDLFMLDVARANGWNAADDYKRWVYEPIRHTPRKGASAFAQAILKKL